jgi:hypothetical protein
LSGGLAGSWARGSVFRVFSFFITFTFFFFFFLWRWQAAGNVGGALGRGRLGEGSWAKNKFTRSCFWRRAARVSPPSSLDIDSFVYCVLSIVYA